ncbi:hypothetical protein ACVWXU_000413 [Streptomyces sp. TE33382]
MFTALSSNTDHGSGTRQRCRHDGTMCPRSQRFYPARSGSGRRPTSLTPRAAQSRDHSTRASLRSASRTAVRTLLTVVRSHPTSSVPGLSSWTGRNRHHAAQDDTHTGQGVAILGRREGRPPQQAGSHSPFSELLRSSPAPEGERDGRQLRSNSGGLRLRSSITPEGDRHLRPGGKLGPHRLRCDPRSPWRATATLNDQWDHCRGVVPEHGQTKTIGVKAGISLRCGPRVVCVLGVPEPRTGQPSFCACTTFSRTPRSLQHGRRRPVSIGRPAGASATSRTRLPWRTAQVVIPSSRRKGTGATRYS